MVDKPNLVFIFSDRQRFDTMACYGNDWIKTPHLNALAQESFVFENCYVTQPVCAPARSSIMTGLFPHATGLSVNKRNLNPDLKTIAEMVSPDFLRAYYGKWHLGDEVVPQHGFTEWRSVMERLWEEYTKVLAGGQPVLRTDCRNRPRRGRHHQPHATWWHGAFHRHNGAVCGR